MTAMEADALALRLGRGFGPDDPVPVSVLSRDERSAVPDPRRAGEADADLFGDGDIQALCRRGGVGRWLPVATCRSCEFLLCASLVPGTRGGPERRWRVQCGTPLHFPLVPSGLTLPAEARSTLERALRTIGRALSAAEGRWFAGREAAATTCPEARARLGTWRVLAPACPACVHYAGLAEAPRGLRAMLGLRQAAPAAAVACSVPHGAQLRRVALGADVLPSGRA